MVSDKYNISQKINENNRYVVYTAKRIPDGNPVSIQTFRTDFPSFRDINLLKQEFHLLSKLSHPNLLGVLEMDRMGNLPVLVNEEISGISLSSYLSVGKLGILDFLKIAIELTKGLLYLHSKKIIHKNINPNHILVEPNTKHIKIWGFDFAVERGRDLAYSNVAEALELGLHYISPEQTGRMNRPIDFRSDLYSLGAVFYEMLTGSRLFKIEEPMELIHAQLALVPEPLVKLRPDLPEMIDRIVTKLLQKNMEERYQTCVGLMYDLEQCLDRLLDTNEITQFSLASHDHSDQFQIASRLYGREKEIALLEESFKRIQSGPVELALVAGYSGVGKSRFVKEFQKHVELSGGFFISGKFEQYKKNPPLSSLLGALNDLIDQLLILGDEQRNFWKEVILQTLGNSGQLILDILPDLELLIGPQPPIPSLPVNEASNRFDQIFNSFVRCFAREDHPLCIFLDDLQWLDSTTRRWLETTLHDPGLQHLQIISAYRENEVSESHPLRLMIDRLRAVHVHIMEVHLKPLEKDTVRQLIAESLRIKESKAEQLTDIVFRKTLGNPFFVRQCLLTLYETGAIFLSPNSQEWSYSPEKVNRIQISDNVIDLMTELFFRLPQEVQTNLKYASCIGTIFSVSTLSELVKLPEEELDLQMQLAEKLCILENIKLKDKSEEGDYSFQHDKIQQAALGLISEEEKKEIRLQIAASLLASKPGFELSDHLYIVVDHFNFASDLIEDLSMVNRLVELNLTASSRAQSSNSYESSLAYIKKAMELVNDFGLEIPESFHRDLQLQRAESEHLSGFNKAAEYHFGEALRFASDEIDKARVTIRIIQFYNNLRRFQDAFRSCRETSLALGVKIPAKFSPPILIKEFLTFKILKGNRKVEDLINLPEIKDEKLKIAIKLMAAAAQSAFQIQPELCVAVCAKMVNLSLQNGNSEGAIIGYLGFGPVFHSGILKQWNLGFKFGELTLALVEKYQSHSSRAEANFVTGYFAVPWKRPAPEMEKFWQVAYEAGLEAGDQFHASCAASATVQSHFMRGLRFDLILDVAKSYLDYLKRISNEEGILTIYAVIQSIKNLRLQTDSPESYSDPEFEEVGYIEKLQHFRSRHFAHFYYINKMQSLYLYEKYEEAYQVALVSDRFLPDSPGMLHTAEHYFYKGLILAGKNSGKSSPRKDRGKLHAIVSKFRKYSETCPTNFIAKKLILEAEYARMKGNLGESERFLYQAIEASETYEYLQIQALANSLLFRLNLHQDKRKIALLHLHDAQYLYELWGAEGIAELLRKKKGEANFSEKELRIGLSGQQNKTYSRENIDVDLRSVIKSTEAISKQIRLRDLLETMMKIILENAGAQRMVFLMKDENQFWTVQAESATDMERPVFFDSTSLQTYDNLPKELIKQVVKVKESVILDYAFSDKRWLRDPYFQTQQSKSVLCLPLIKQNTCTGIIYLENNLIEGAFSKDRIDLINILSGQMAISLENAILYENMEEKIKQRTQELQEEKEKSDELLLNILPLDIAEELKQNGSSKARSFDQVSVMFTDIVNFSSICEQMSAEELVAELNDFYSHFDKIIESYGIEKIKTIGDSYMCAGGLNERKDFDHSRMILAAMEIREWIQKHKQENLSGGKNVIDMRIGIHTGPVIAGIVGLKKFAYDIWGDSVNIASRMETAGEPGKINVSQDTKTLIEGEFNCIPRGKIQVKNKGSIEMYFVEPKEPSL
jgi:predicted ATPase/class 3 adenylate cyclase